MLRRSRRLSEAKEAVQCNGGAINTKKIKLDENDVRNNNKHGETVINNNAPRVILNLIPFDLYYN